MWLSSGQRIRKTNHYNHYSDSRESDWEVDYYLRMRRAASPRAKVGRRGPRALLDARAAIHIIYVIYIKGRRGRVYPLSNYVIYPRAASAAGLLQRFPYQETTRRTTDHRQANSAMSAAQVKDLKKGRVAATTKHSTGNNIPVGAWSVIISDGAKQLNSASP